MSLRRSLLALVCVWWAASAQAQTLAGQAANTQAGTLTSIAQAITVASGDTLYAMLGTRASSGLTGVSDPTNGAWTQIVTRVDDVDATLTGIWCVANTATGSLTVTATFGTTSAAYITLARFTGASCTVNTTGSASNALGATLSNGSITTTGTTLILTSAVTNNGGSTKTVASGYTAFTQLTADDRPYAQYKNSASSETTTGTFSVSPDNSGRAVHAAFTISGGGCTGGLALLGAGKCE